MISVNDIWISILIIYIIYISNSRKQRNIALRYTRLILKYIFELIIIIGLINDYFVKLSLEIGYILLKQLKHQGGQR